MTTVWLNRSRMTSGCYCRNLSESMFYEMETTMVSWLQLMWLRTDPTVAAWKLLATFLSACLQQRKSVYDYGQRDLQKLCPIHGILFSVHTMMVWTGPYALLLWMLIGWVNFYGILNVSLPQILLPKINYSKKVYLPKITKGQKPCCPTGGYCEAHIGQEKASCNRQGPEHVQILARN